MILIRPETAYLLYMNRFKYFQKKSKKFSKIFKKTFYIINNMIAVTIELVKQGPKFRS